MNEFHILVAHELKEIDKKILKELEKGTRNPSWLAEELDYSRQYVHQRLQILTAGNLTQNIGHGLYEITEKGKEKTTE